MTVQNGRSAASSRYSSQLNSDLQLIFQQLQDHCVKDRRVTGVPTGYKDLDFVTAGFQPGELIVLAGRPGMGKTSFAMNIALHAAVARGEHHVVFFSTDHTREDLTSKFLAMEARVDISRLRMPTTLQEQDWKHLQRAAGELHDCKIDTHHSSWLAVSEIREKIQKAKEAERSPHLVIIDKFYSLIIGNEPQEGSNNRTNEQFQIVIELKKIAKEFGCAILLLADINKSMEARDSRAPKLVDVKDGSAALESYSDQVLLIYRNPYVGEANEGELVLAKSRSWDTPAAIKLAFHGRFGKWSDFAYEEKPSQTKKSATKDVF